MAYADTDELFRVLKVRGTPTSEQTAAAERCLEAAAGEIDSEIDLAADVTLEPWQLELVTAVNLERAAEWWAQQEIHFGIVLSGDTALGGGVGERIARDTWERHALKLAPLKNQWGLA